MHFPNFGFLLILHQSTKYNITYQNLHHPLIPQKSIAHNRIKSVDYFTQPAFIISDLSCFCLQAGVELQSLLLADYSSHKLFCTLALSQSRLIFPLLSSVNAKKSPVSIALARLVNFRRLKWSPVLGSPARVPSSSSTVILGASSSCAIGNYRSNVFFNSSVQYCLSHFLFSGLYPCVKAYHDSCCRAMKRDSAK